jgi:hypothetical protein
LRFSGRLMVIQNAYPRFSRITLLSFIAVLACWCRVTICGRSADDRERDFAIRPVICRQCRTSAAAAKFVLEGPAVLQMSRSCREK